MFAVQPEAAKKSSGKEIAFWSVADGSDTMISLWNPLNAAQDMAFTFHYADGSGEYRLPIHLTAKADTMISVAELRMTGKPDVNGNTFSATAQEGSASLTNLADPHGEQTVVVSTGTFNVRTATCGGGCNLCRGLTNVVVVGPSSVAVSTTAQFSAIANYSDGTSSDVTGGSLWSSSNSSIASVNVAGVVSGVAPGSAGIVASHDGIIGGVCPSPPEWDGGCPTASFDGQQSVTVQVPTSLKFISVSVLPDGSTGAFGCPPSNNYGIRVDIKYQILDQQSPPRAIQSSQMTPHESGTLFDGTAFDNNIGPVNNYPTSSATTAADGTFHDVPFGYCQNTPIDTPRTATQNITIIMNGSSYAVRSQTWSVSAPGSSSFGHGTITNTITSPGTGSDVSAQR